LGAVTSDESSEDELRPRGLYGHLVGLAVTLRWPVVFGAIGLVAASLLLYVGIGSELFPEVDAGTFEVRLKTTPGTRLEETEQLVARLEETIKAEIGEPLIDAIISNVGLPVGKGAGFSTVLSSNSGPDTAYILVNLKSAGRSVSTQEYVARLRRVLYEQYPREQFLFVTGGIVNLALNQGVPVPISVQVSGGSLGVCRKQAEDLVELLKGVRGAADVQIAQTLDAPQLDIQVDRTKAKFLGLDQEEVAQNILTALGSSVGYKPTIWVDPEKGTDFFMGVQYASNELQSLDDIRNIPLSLNTADGPVTIPLSNVATVRRVNIPGEIQHYNISRVYDVHINVEGRDVGSVAADVERKLKDFKTEPGVKLTLRGPVTTMRDGVKLLGAGLIVAAVLVYLVLMAQFKSFIDPLLIMLAVPLGMTGVLAVLFVTRTTINIQSLMGTLMMIGVVVNNSILLVEFANQLVEQGRTPRDAAIAAAQIRLRPILMTSLTLVAAMLPLCFHLAPGGEAMIPLARALVGGMVASTFLTLFLIPAAYVIVR